MVYGELLKLYTLLTSRLQKLKMTSTSSTILSSITQLDSLLFRDGTFDDNCWPLINEAANKMRKWKVYMEGF